MAHTHWKVRFEETDPVRIDLLIGLLNQAGFEGFEVGDQALDAYITAGHPGLEALLWSLERDGFPTADFSPVEDKNWNEIWESSFQPVVIPGKVSIRASFHPPIPEIPLELVITPKMSFGTGHHLTTLLMMEALFQLNLTGKRLLDFGTGTGILAILAEKLGAARILAIDNDPWSISNANENVAGNHCQSIETRLLDHLPTGETFDLILANINKNVILKELPAFLKSLQRGGSLMLSGLQEEDLTDVRLAMQGTPLQELSCSIRDPWARISFFRT